MVYKTDVFPDNILCKFLFAFEKKRHIALSSWQLTSMLLRIISDIIINFNTFLFWKCLNVDVFFRLTKLLEWIPCCSLVKKPPWWVSISFFFSFLLSCHSQKILAYFFFKCVDPNLILSDSFSFITETALIFSELCCRNHEEIYS